MDREPDPEGGSEFGDGPHADRLEPRQPDEFDAIVAGWIGEGDVPRWPADETVDETDETVHGTDDRTDQPTDRPAGPAPLPAATDVPAAPTGRPQPPREPIEEDEHFVPPDPPPLPRLGPPALVGLVLIVLGIVLIVSPGWVGVPGLYGVPLGLVSIASGLGWLVLRLWPDHAADGPDEDDDGAIL